MSKKVSLGAAIMMMAMAAAVSITVTMIFAMNLFNGNISDLTQRQSLFKKLSDVDALVRQNYIGKMDETTLNDDIIRGYIAGTGDKHGNYYDAKTYKDVELSYQGKGIGIGVSVIKDTSGNIKVVSVANGSPANLSGVLAGDVITKIGTQTVQELGYDKAVSQLKGNSGTQAEFTVKRNGTEIPFAITRKQYETQTVESRMINNLGYVRIIEFDSNTYTQFVNALNSVISKGAKGILFDVRNNPGGRLDSVENILDKLLPKGPIVSSTDKSGKTKVLRYSDANEVKLPMAVLTNENTASAAELFTCALKDYGKAKSIGVKTYGKGTMQQTFPLNDGSAVVISIAYFNPPKSANFDGKGVQPDITVELSKDKENRFYELTDDEDDQLQSAVRYLNSQTGVQ